MTDALAPLHGLAPLSDRVPAPELPTPTHPEVAEWRPATVEDIDLVLEVQQAQDRVDHPNYLTSREEIERDFGHHYVDLAKDSLLAIADDGQLLANGLVIFPPVHDTLVRSILLGGVHPEFRGRGIGRELLAWQEARALNQLATSTKPLPGWIMADADERAPERIRLLQHQGFTISRYFLELRRELSDPIPEVKPADDIRIEPYTPAASEQTRAARNDAFRDHWGSQPVDQEQWQSLVAGDTFREDLSFIARAGEDGPVVGLLITLVNEDDEATQGFSSAYIELLAVTRAFRGMRIAPALIARGLITIRAAGYEKAVLDVDTQNTSGALGLYTRMGFEPATRQLSLTKQF
ncbi:MAG: GNAT family N-acetyltransferase [Microbacteriaceae bacterium]